MAVETGTATGHVDLLNKLVTFLTTTMTPIGERWTLNKTATVAGEEERYLEGPGLSGTDNIVVNLRTVTLDDWEIYNWEIQGATSFNGGLTFENQPDANPTGTFNSIRSAPTIVLSNQSMDYTIVANGRRFIVVAKLRNFTSEMYAGFILPYATTLEYTYPLFVGGNSAFTRANYDLNAQNNIPRSSGVSKQDAITSFFNGYGNTTTDEQVAYLWLPSSEWRAATGKDVGSTGGTTQVTSWPWSLVERQQSSRIRYNGLTAIGGDYILFPGVLCWSLSSTSTVTLTAPQLAEMMTYGEYDGVYFVSAFNLTPLDTFTISTIDYLVVKNDLDPEFKSAAAIKKA